MIRQACAVPYRMIDGRLEYCLITSASGKRWIFPKGIIDPGETLGETALKEAWEEAGVEGRVVGAPLGVYRYHKWETILRVQVVLMQVTAQRDEWPESPWRRRQWATLIDARRLLHREELREMLQRADDRLRNGAGSEPGAEGAI